MVWVLNDPQMLTLAAQSSVKQCSEVGVLGRYSACEGSDLMSWMVPYGLIA